jgi:hypothetical protein
MQSEAVITNSQRLRAKITMVLPHMAAASRALAAHPRLRELYPDHLFTAHCITRASVPLMQAALAQSQAMSATDPIAAELVHYFTKHIPEELHHDDWLLEDLEALGLDRDEILARPPSPTVAAVVGSQYYWIFHHHPVALLGYIAVMEGYPPSAGQIEYFVEKTGYPREAFRTMTKHAQLDPQHGAELDEMLDSLPLQPHHWSILGVSALQTVLLGTRAVEEAIEAHDGVGSN